MSPKTRCIETITCFFFLFACGSIPGKAWAQGSHPQVASLPAETEILRRIAFGSCAKHWQHQPIWDAVIAEAARCLPVSW